MRKGEKLVGAKKKAFVERMAKYRRRAARSKNDENPRRKHRKSNPENPSRKRRRARRRNPGAVAGAATTLKPLLIKAAGLVGGVLVGAKAADITDEFAISKIDNKHVQAGAFVAVAVALLFLGTKYSRKIENADLRMAANAATFGVVTPMLLTAAAIEKIGTGLVQTETQGAWQPQRRIDPRLVAGMGPMSGSLISGPGPGLPVMAGTLIDETPGLPVMRGAPMIPKGLSYERGTNGSLL